MSLQSWKDEFYPVPATKAAHDPLVAAEHSLRKWKGLRESELERHGIEKAKSVFIRERLFPMVYFAIDEESCSLCIFDDRQRRPTECEACPLFRACNSVPCHGAFRSFTGADDPEPMIAILEETVEYAKGNR